MKLVGWGLLLAVALLTSFVLLLQIDSVSTTLGRRVAASLSGPSMSMEVDRVTGSWFRGLALTGLRVSSSDSAPGEWRLEADSLSVGYNLLALLQKTVSVTRVQGAGVHFELRMAPSDSTSPGESPSAEAAPDTASPWSVLAESIQVRDGEVLVWEASTGDSASEPASPWALAGAQLAARDLHLVPGFALTVDSLQGRFRPSGEDDPWGRVMVAGRVNPEGIALDTLLLESPESHVSAGGILPLDLRDPAPGSLDLRLEARPLHLADLGPLLPAALPDTLRLNIQGGIHYQEGGYGVELLADAGSGDRLEARARADSLRGFWEGDFSTRIQALEAQGRAGFTPGALPEWMVEGFLAYDPTTGAGALPGLGSALLATEFSLEGSGISPDSLSLRSEFQVDSATVGPARLRDTRLVAGVESRAESARISSRLALADSGELLLRGSWTPGTRGGRARVDSLSFHALNLRTLLAQPDSLGVPETLLNGSLRGSADLLAGGDWSGEGTLLLDSTRIGPQAIAAGRVRVQGQSSAADVELALVLPPGEIQGALRVEGWDTTPVLSIRRLAFRDLDPDPFLRGGEENTGQTEEKVTRVSGRLEGRSVGFNPREAMARFSLALDSSQVAGVSLASAELEAESDSGRVNARLRAAAFGGSVEMEGEGSLMQGLPTYSARGALHHDALGAGMGGGEAEETGPRGSVHARFGLEGEGIHPDSLRAEVWMEVDSARWDQVAVEAGRLEMRTEDGVLRLDTLTLRSRAVSLSGGGSLPLSSAGGRAGELRVQGRVERADMLAGLVGAEVLNVGEATFQARATGTLEDIALQGQARINALLMDRTQVQGLALDFEGRRTLADGITQGAGTLTVDRLLAGSFPVRSLEAEANLEEGKELAITASAVLDDSRDARMSLRLEDVPGSPSILVERFEFRADEDQWVLQEPGRLRFAGGLAMDTLRLTAGQQTIQAGGRLGRSGPLDLGVEVRDFRIGTLSDLLGYPALQGDVSGSVAFAGTAGDPRFDARLLSRLEATRGPSSEVELTAGYQGNALDFRADIGMAGARGLRLEGALPFRLSFSDTTGGLVEDRGMRITATADSLPLAWMSPFLSEEQVQDIQGTLTGEAEITGSPGAPVLDGALTLARAGVRLPALGVRYDQGRARIRFQGETMLLDSLSVRSGSGTLTASGSIGIPHLAEPEYDLAARARSFRAVRSSRVEATVSGDLQVSGVGLRPDVSGNVVVRRADLYLDELASRPRVEDVVLTEEDYRELARVFGYQEPSGDRESPRVFQGLSMDVNVELRRDSWLRQRSNPEMAVQFSGNLSVQKEAGDSLRLVGQVEAVPSRSYVEQFGRRFSLARGTLVFQGAPMATEIDLRAEYEVPSRENPDEPEVVIALTVSGTPEDLRLELSSSPTLEASDMVSYLAVGRPADRTLGGGEGSLSETGGALALGRLSGAVEAYAREEVGLDVVEITTDGTEGMILLAGRYISPDLYLGIRQPVSLQRTSGESSERNPNPEFEVELQAVRWLLLNLQAGGRSGVELFVRSRISYE